jgi:hypothetical protein
MTTPEEITRQNIDAQLKACGWAVQSRTAINLFAGQGVAVRGFPLDTGIADYLLFVDKRTVGPPSVFGLKLKYSGDSSLVQNSDACPEAPPKESRETTLPPGSSRW